MVTRIIRFSPFAAPGVILGVVLGAVLAWALFATPFGVATAEPAATQKVGGLIAPRSICRPQLNEQAPFAKQEQAMRCLTNYARERAGLPALVPNEQLGVSADRKSGDVVRCEEFSHSACGRYFTYWIERSGYLAAACWHVAENLAWGVYEYGTPRSIFRAWMASPEHRPHILDGDLNEFGIGLRAGWLGFNWAHVWTTHFGKHCAPNTSPGPEYVPAE